MHLGVHQLILAKLPPIKMNLLLNLDCQSHTNKDALQFVSQRPRESNDEGALPTEVSDHCPPVFYCGSGGFCFYSVWGFCTI